MRAREHRQRQHQQERGHQHRPDEQRHAVHRHARRAHVEDRGDEIDRAEDRRGAGEMQRQDDEIHRRAGRAGLGRERRIEHPAAAEAVHARRAVDEHRDDQQQERSGQQPERDVVHARERHVRRADHQRHEPVAEAADQRRHHHEEDHDDAVRRDEHVVHVLGGVDRAVAGENRRNHREDLDARDTSVPMRIAPDSAEPIRPAITAKIR